MAITVEHERTSPLPVLSTSSARAVGIDLVRIAGVAAVVAGHTWPINPLVRSAVFPWHVPIFFFLSGYLWRPGRTIREEVSGRGRSLLVPYLACLVLVGALFLGPLALQGRLPGDMVPLTLLGGAFMPAKPFMAFWFMTALFLAAVLYRVLDGVGLRGKWVAALLGVAAATVWPAVLGHLPLAAGVSVIALLFLVAGETLRRHRRQIPAGPLVGAIATVAGFAAVFSGLARPLDLKPGDVGTPVLSLAASVAICAGLTLLTDLVGAVPAAVSKVVTRLAGCGLFVVLLHPFVLWATEGGGLPSLVRWLLALGLPWGAALLVASTPLAPVLLGTRPRRRLRS